MGKQTTTSSGTSNSNFNSTQTPTNPSWVTSGLAGLGSNVSNLSNLDPYSLVAGANPLQTQAGSTAAGLGGTSSAAFGGALDGTGAVMGAPTQYTAGVSAAPFINRYMNPFMNDVVKSSLAGYDQNSNLQNQQEQLKLAGDTTFGGSGGSIESALLRGQQGLGRGQLESGLRSQGFETALGAANNDAGRYQGASDLNAQLSGQALQRQLEAAGQLGTLASGLDANTRANVGAQSTIGDQLRGIDQAQRLAPITTNGALSSIWSSLPLGLLHGQDMTGTQTGATTNKSTQTGAGLGDWLNFFAANANAAAKAAGGGG